MFFGIELIDIPHWLRLTEYIYTIFQVGQLGSLNLRKTRVTGS
jgi:hypothetical protein